MQQTTHSKELTDLPTGLQALDLSWNKIAKQLAGFQRCSNGQGSRSAATGATNKAAQQNNTWKTN